jgi:hypothetical protein
MTAQIPTIVHNGTTTLPYQTFIDISASNVVGSGTYIVSPVANLVFMHGVGGGETISLSNVGAKGIYTHPANELVIGDPANFHGHVNLTYIKPIPGAPIPDIASQPSNIVLDMASQVDSYSYKNDMLKLWLGNKVVETLNLTVHDPYGFTVQKPVGVAGFNDVVVSANTADGTHGVVWYGKFRPEPLALHTDSIHV